MEPQVDIYLQSRHALCFAIRCRGSDLGPSVNRNGVFWGTSSAKASLLSWDKMKPCTTMKSSALSNAGNKESRALLVRNILGYHARSTLLA
jgi:hypothetical protein